MIIHIFSSFFPLRFGPTRLGQTEEAIFYRSMSMRCVCDRYVIYIYIYMMMNVVHNRKVVRSFVRIVVAKLEKITL